MKKATKIKPDKCPVSQKGVNASWFADNMMMAPELLAKAEPDGAYYHISHPCPEPGCKGTVHQQLLFGGLGFSMMCGHCKQHFHM